MALNNFARKEPESNNDEQRLMCSVHGCPNRWSVHSDGEKPKCSKHQWGKVKDLDVKSQLPKLETPVDMDAWWQK
jgi:hypothetical protein